MPVTGSHKDVDALTLTFTAHLDATPERAWQPWADPRQLERWWGPPTYPATVTAHDLTVGGEVRYYMTSPEGEKYHAWFRVLAATPPTALEFQDGFADANGSPDLSMPTGHARVTMTASTSGGTDLEMSTTYESLEALEQVVAMGVIDGMTEALGQIDAILSHS